MIINNIFTFATLPVTATDVACINNVVAELEAKIINDREDLQNSNN